MSLHEGGRSAPQNPPQKRHPRAPKTRHYRRKGQWHHSRKPNDRKVYIWVHDAERDHGASRSTLHLWLIANKLRSLCYIDGRRLMVPVELIERWAKHTDRRPGEVARNRRDLITQKQASAILGDGANTAARAARVGLLRRVKGRYSTHLYYRAEVEELKRTRYAPAPLWLVPIAKIREELGVHPDTISRALKRLDITPTRYFCPIHKGFRHYVQTADATRLRASITPRRPRREA